VGVTLCCHFAISGSGDLPCSQNNNIPSSFRTQCICRRAFVLLEILQSVKQSRIVSTLLFSKGISSPGRSNHFTLNGDLLILCCALRRIPFEGSSPQTKSTVLGLYRCKLIPLPIPTSSTIPRANGTTRSLKLITEF
jgi:hypothetical protein